MQNSIYHKHKLSPAPRKRQREHPRTHTTLVGRTARAPFDQAIHFSDTQRITPSVGPRLGVAARVDKRLSRHKTHTYAVGPRRPHPTTSSTPKYDEFRPQSTKNASKKSDFATFLFTV
jgi:hypothetical protein